MRVVSGILRIAAILVPPGQRAEWLAEWSSETWYAHRMRGGLRTAFFASGAFPDALWIRRNSPPTPALDLLRFQSPLRCGLFLAALAATSFWVAFALPGRSGPIRPGVPENAVLLSPHNYFGAQLSTATIEQYHAWTDGANGLFSGAAFYQPAAMTVRTAQRETARMSVASVSGDLFPLLGVAIPRISKQDGTAVLILSHACWRKYFDGDPEVRGRVLDVAGRKARVTAVLPAGSSRLPGKIDAWLLGDDPLPESKGFIVARVKPAAFHPGRSGRWRVPVSDENGQEDAFYCHTLAEAADRPFTVFLMVVALAFAILPVTTSLSLGEYSGARIRQWIFLSIKIGFVLVIIYCGSHFVLKQQWSGGWIDPLVAGTICAFRWVLIDQRRRCPVCLCLVSNPARVGQASRNFLGWSGTEFMCTRGHGLLHVPEFPTSWFSTQRWLYLDASWNGLFR